MHEMHARCAAATSFPTVAHAVDPRAQLSPIAMRAIAVQNLHVGAQRHVVAKDAKHWPLLDNASAECVFRLEADNEDRVARIARAVRQVMQNAPRFHHA